MREHSIERLFSVASLCDNRNVAFDFKKGGKRSEHHALILGENHANSFAAFLCRIHLLQLSLAGKISSIGISFSGRVIVSVVPAALSR